MPLYSRNTLYKVQDYPPPTRGTLLRYPIRFSRTGITPAYAGNTDTISTTFFQCGDHPRLRGEHLANEPPQATNIGSPPPTRGTRLFELSPKGCSRITPAYAGNTLGGFSAYTPDRDHPRLRGEHPKRALTLLCFLGSPPPTRGTPTAGLFCLFRCGITPAYAGNTMMMAMAIYMKRDHPRLRGEHGSCKLLAGQRGGSPPPTRGTRLYDLSVLPQPVDHPREHVVYPCPDA